MQTVSDFRTAALAASSRLPVFPVALRRALGLLARGDDVSVQQLALVIESDVVLAAKIVAIANSALYARGNQVTSLPRAIARIGIQKTQNALLAVSVGRMFHTVQLPGGWPATRFNAHSLATAILSDLIVRALPAVDPEWAFLSGLFHDIGLLLLAAGLPDEFAALSKAYAQAQAETSVWVASERQLLGFSHFELGADLLARWNFAPCVRNAVRECEEARFPFPEPLSLASVATMASQLADAKGISVFPPPQAQAPDSGAPKEPESPRPDPMEDLLGIMKVSDPALFIKSFDMEFSELLNSFSNR